MSTPQQPSLSLIVPCFNEEDVLPLFWRRVSGLLGELTGHAPEVLFIDDGSTDGAVNWLRKLSGEDPRVRVLVLARNYGQQRAIAAGLDHAAGDYVFILDADLQDPPELIRDMLAKLEEGADVVHAVRRKRRDGLVKRGFAYWSYGIMKRWVLPELPRNAAEFKGMRREVVETLRHYRERARFNRGIIATVGYRQDVVYYERPRRSAGRSKFPARSVLRLARDAVASNTVLPLRLALYAGGGLLLLWPVALLILCLRVWLFGLSPLGAATFLLVWLLGGIILLMQGIMGEYIKVLMMEVKQRPLYIVREAINVNTDAAAAITRQPPAPFR